VFRSFVLRRRFRRRVEAAIAAGVLLPEQVDALRRRGPPIGEKPKMFEVQIDGRHKEGYEPSSPALQNPPDEWSNIMPVSAAIIPGDKSKGPAPIPVPAPQQYSARPLNARRPFWFLRAPDITPTPILPVHNPVSSPSSSPPISRAPQQNGSSSSDSADDMLQLTVLIAMPNAQAPQYQSRQTSMSSEGLESAKGKGTSVSDHGEVEEEEIPEVVFGVTEVRWEGGANWTAGDSATPEAK